MKNLLSYTKEMSLDELFNNYEKLPPFIKIDFYKYYLIIKSLNYKIL